MKYHIARVDVKRLAFVCFWVWLFLALVAGAIWLLWQIVIMQLLGTHLGWSMAESLGGIFVEVLLLLISVVMTGIGGLILGALIGFGYNWLAVRRAGPLVVILERFGQGDGSVISECAVE